jgi:putative restriction endonuclease
MSQRVFGHLPGVPVGTVFSSRKELLAAGVHGQNQAGISGTERGGADAIVVSGG